MTDKKTLDDIIESEKKSFHKDTFVAILKNWGTGFAKLPQNEKLDALKEILKLAGIELGGSPAEGLAIKIAEGRRRDNDTQERIRQAQALNLAVEMLPEKEKEKLYNNPNLNPKIMDYIKNLQSDFYNKLGDQNGNNN